MTHVTAWTGRLAACVFALGGAAAPAQAESSLPAPPSAKMQLEAPLPPRAQAARGELLYTTHCIACHTTQVHWRAKRAVTDWASLKAEVRRWAANGGLGWSDEEVVDVARYLNATIYRLPATAGTELGARDPLPRS